jgi:HD-GYP domain-containing protein (c-di-GMP phosphodiesterase class II)
MQYSPLALVQQRIHLRAPLPFNVRDHDGTLLLARGRVVETAEQMAALFARGALVDLAELQQLLKPAERVQQARPEELPGLWSECLHDLNDSLRHSATEGFLDALQASTPAVLALVERDKDLAIFQVMRQDGNEHVQYGVTHSTHAAITAYLVAQRLGWSADETQRVFKATLTMNISMLELQGQLALQTTPPTPEQRDAIKAHPHFSRLMLEISGVTDADWLAAVANHHEKPDGSGYPAGRHDSGDLAALVQRADIYTAKLSPRATRNAVAADKAGRMMFMQEPGHPMVSALVKEFGVYPSGSFVKLMSGETGLVVKRGATVMTPIVAVLSSPQGASLPQPLRRDTSQREYAIHSLLGGHTAGVRLSPGTLMAALAA